MQLGIEKAWSNLKQPLKVSFGVIGVGVGSIRVYWGKRAVLRLALYLEGHCVWNNSTSSKSVVSLHVLV